MPKLLIYLFIYCMSSSIGFSYTLLNYGFLEDTAGSYFTNKDWTMFNRYQLKALNISEDGKKVSWRNTKSGNWGSFIPFDTFVKNGNSCRKLTITNSANFRVGQTTLTFCKISGHWKGM
ncbi:hypothetical protein N9L02_03165 [Gammaproteobacteria bacterium]|nr:hypothetical protein [Gammaproteobacteria bacterium]